MTWATPLKKGSKQKLPTSITKSAIKLAVALELRQEGYANIQFDRTLEFSGQKMLIHVLAEDEIGLKLGVYCINRKNELNPNELLDIVTAIQEELGDDGDVAIALPIYLLGNAEEIFGLTPRVFLVDYDMRVWSHSNDGGVTQMLKPERLELDELDESSESGDENGLLNNERLYNFQYIV